MALFKKPHTVIFSLVLFFLTTVATHAADATFSWTPNTDSISGYKIHYGTSSRTYTFVTDVGLPAAVNGSIIATVEGLQEGTTYYFAATAYLADKESGYSVEVMHTVPGTPTPEPPPATPPPTASNISLQGSEDTPLTGQMNANSSEGILTFTAVSQPGHGTVTIQDDTGSFTYTPALHYWGDDIFSYTITNSAGTSSPATVTIHLSSINDAPVADSTSISLNENTSYSGQLSGRDVEDSNLTYSLVAEAGQGTVNISTSGQFSYLPQLNISGSDSFTFKVNDGSRDSNIATVHVTITPVNGPPVTEDPDVSTNETTSDFAFESGELVVTSAWQHVAFSNEYTAPSVIAKSTTRNDPEAGIVSISNLTSSGFDIRIREWDRADGNHPQEIVSYMAMERGQHQITDNIYAIAECTSLSGLNTFQPIHFASSLSSPPVVLSSIVTENEANTATLRMKEITTQGFSVTMQEQENNDGSHAEETVCYIAMEEWSGVVDGLMIEVGSTEQTLSDKSSTISFKQQFPVIPFLLADMQSTNDIDTAIVGISDLSVTNAGLTVLEEQSADSEMSHPGEIGGYIAVSPYNPEEDSDNDGLTNEEEDIIHTHPGLWDTDQDAINDGNEYDHWLVSGIHPEIDSDGDGKSNLQDNDSDNDGFPDGVEIFNGFNPADRHSSPSFKFEIGELTVGADPVWIRFQNSYKEPAVIVDTVIGSSADQDIIRISNITADGCNIQLQTNDSPDNNHNTTRVSFIVIENYIETVIDNSAPVEAPQITPDPVDEPQVAPEPVDQPEVTPEPADEPQVTSRRFNVKNMSSIISLFNQMIENFRSSR